MAWTRWRVNRAKLATDPEMSAMTTISGLEGLGYLKRGSTGTPPVESEWRTVFRKSSGPFRPWRRLRASRTANFRDSGWSAPRNATSSSLVACMKSMSSGSGLRSDLASASLPRSATNRRRISFSISWRSLSIRDWYSSRTNRSSSPVRPEDPLPSASPFPGAGVAPVRACSIRRCITPSRSRFRNVR